MKKRHKVIRNKLFVGGEEKIKDYKEFLRGIKRRIKKILKAQKERFGGMKHD